MKTPTCVDDRGGWCVDGLTSSRSRKTLESRQCRSLRSETWIHSVLGVWANHMCENDKVTRSPSYFHAISPRHQHFLIAYTHDTSASDVFSRTALSAISRCDLQMGGCGPAGFPVVIDDELRPGITGSRRAFNFCGRGQRKGLPMFT